MANARIPGARALLLVAVTVVLGCSDSSGPDTTPASITISGLPATMDAVGATLQIQAVVLNAGGDPLPSASVQWSSSNSSAVSVSATGLLTSLANGETTIRAELPEGLQATGRVTVLQAPASIAKVQGDGQRGSIGVTLTEPFIVRVLDSQGTPMSTGSVSFEVVAGRGSFSSASDVQTGPGEVAVRYRPAEGIGQHQILATAGQLQTIFAVDVAYPPVRIVNESMAPAIVGISHDIDLNATGGNGVTYTWSVTSGDLPPGLTLFGSLGRIFGVPNLTGSFTFDLTVTSQGVQDTKTFTIDVHPRISIVENGFGPFFTGQSYQVSLEATGGLPQQRQWTAAGLPPGFSVSEAGVLTATPSQVGSFSTTFRVASGPDNDSWFTTLNVYDPLEFVTPPSLPNARVSSYYSQDISVRGGNGRSYDNDLEIVAGLLPPGIRLSLNTLSGIPTQAGTYRFTLRFTDNDQVWVERQFTLIVSS